MVQNTTMTRIIPVRVLVIDDEDALCRKAAAWLTEAGFDVATFTDPAAGLVYAQKASVQLALLDLRLPDWDGAELVAAMQRAAPQARILALAAFPDVPQVLAAVRAGARDILEKPLQAAGLLAALERQLAEGGLSVRSETDYNRRVGARIRARRAESNLTLNDVAGICSLSAAQLSQIELGKTGTSTWTLARIASALRTSPAALLDGI
jgi:DNA-binding NtrC family response regulator